jgi:hypothetical protein
LPIIPEPAGSADGLETRRWNGTKSAFADYAEAVASPIKGAAASDARRIVRLLQQRSCFCEYLVRGDSLVLTTTIGRHSSSDLLVPGELYAGGIVIRTFVQAGDQTVREGGAFVNR